MAAVPYHYRPEVGPGPQKGRLETVLLDSPARGRIFEHPGGTPMTLIEKYLTLKSNYRNYDTKFTLKLMQAFRRIVPQLAEKGYTVAFDMLGSINFGIADETSDADCILYHYCDIHADRPDCPDVCPNLIFEQQEIRKTVRKRLNDKTFKVEFLEVMNLKFLEGLMSSPDLTLNEAVFRFLFYRSIARPVNRPLLEQFQKRFETIPDLKDNFSEHASRILESYLNTSSHRYSFNKYNERIINRGINIPPEFFDELKQYLGNAPK